ncbi:uncharacterized protein BYT42DRAFT_609639 [Radiomyces spectabilis]|uniref:uncharacterized protein n=1 Tax=Radiomyces spectabilis TaxID=64574 RepID=UPI00221F495E|nr:uncharacterized protein BYT42DRAFT_609639 [Radiomyces spectabilis]KAI8393874.1 hypothetical protein BYT42DRAFT_609639 [Radiomyces spectabilis]
MVTLEKIYRRITHSKWTKAYVILACLQGITIIILQSIIAYQNTSQVALLVSDETALHLFRDSNPHVAMAIDQAADRLKRIKWENIAFIGFQFWFVGMSFDSTIYQNSAEVIALAVLNFVCAVLGALEVVDGRRWLRTLRNLKNVYDLNISTDPLRLAYYLEIVLAACLALFACAFAFLSYQVVRQLGWVIYKKIGGDIAIQKMYRTFQFFVLALKIDIFIEFLVSCFYIGQFVLKAGFEWKTYVFVIVTFCMLPMFYFARMTICAEGTKRMIIFIIFQIVIFFQFILILGQTITPEDFWYTWICFVVVGMILAIATSVLGFMCLRNFGKGLEPYVQRGAKKQEQMDRLELNKHSTSSSWQIDDD